MDYVVPHAMEKRMGDITAEHPEMVEALGGMEFQTAFTMMSEVLTNHMKWILDSTASKMGMT